MSYVATTSALTRGATVPGHATTLDVPLQGSMGGYYTAEEIKREMERLVTTYPEWLAPAQRLGTTRQGHLQARLRTPPKRA